MAINEDQIAAVQLAWQNKINLITDDLVVAEANILLQRYIDTLGIISSIESGTVSSYSIAGRSVTKSNINDMKTSIDELKNQLARLIMSNRVIMDMSKVQDY